MCKGIFLAEFLVVFLATEEDRFGLSRCGQFNV